MIAAVSAATPLGRPTTSINNAAAASTGNPACTYASTARRHSWSIISIAAGTIPPAITALTVDAPASTVSKSISIVHTAGGFGVRRTSTFVATPSIPSLPTKTPRRS